MHNFIKIAIAKGSATLIDKERNIERTGCPADNIRADGIGACHGGCAVIDTSSQSLTHTLMKVSQVKT